MRNAGLHISDVPGLLAIRKGVDLYLMEPAGVSRSGSTFHATDKAANPSNQLPCNMQIYNRDEAYI